ncbi:MAG: 3-deoxy-manno-octulosonate cytidylyltransferase [Verrucomicrobiae bacterium]|nr:3-deoxy-manno-octulosonate cytidylyltransferase [Verrucomicrobiae bacterium]
MPPSCLIVIPARYASSRFPGKPLTLIAGASLIERVYRRCLKIGENSEVVVGTDDPRILNHVKAFGGKVVLTRADHPSGTDRVAEVARRFRAPLIVNVQGDEPLLEPKTVRQLIRLMKRKPRLEMATLCHPISSDEEYLNPNAVKVVVNRRNEALYFSRAPIPHQRSPYPSIVKTGRIHRHIGIYAFRRSFLFQYVKWPQSFLEKAEQLEQLRALENGARIGVIPTPCQAIGVDTPEDVARVEAILRKDRKN